ncbi:prephenate dehydrogenase [Corynebacterium aquilae]|uniref:Prephenate dehydrogenase n=1 Tax=Corynebacterium aquilae DSM 44791 TaxID=1431546 RepID=A0A1L7CDA5_9CORY|nr:prephenate dehydrogenase [Corynebacterium aquilae]APT83825.1 prephenate dehydrogenase [Corynebacterium aquilae DSM 44791]
MTTQSISRPVCILGLGLIGGSLLRDVAACDASVFGFNRSPSGAQAARDEGFDVSDDLEATLLRAQEVGALIVLAVPMPAVASLLDDIVRLAPDCGVTDVVSVKAQVWELIKQRGMEDRYVGGHPMAGTADSGWSAAQLGLFKGAAWVVTFDHAVEREPSQEWVNLWVDVALLATMVGAQVIPARVDAHDKAVARISHLPHVLAETLAIVGDHGGALTLSLAAGSFRDGTRVAGSAPSLVRAMCETNHEALLTALDEALALLQDARANLVADSPSVEELVDAGYRSRIRYEARSLGKGGRPVLRVRPGQAGWVQQLLHAEDVGARVDVF